ncbi:MAG: pyruvate:ferredoxin (flavodoxin) oxidoreductase, partial [Oscillospiraceae bacterium]
PGMKGAKALEMKPLEDEMNQQAVFEYGLDVPKKAEIAAKFAPDSVKGSQFLQPLLEFSGACGGCGETPYAKLVTQLYGDRMYIANATGCSSIWGGSAPATPYTVNKEGHGPAWSNSLFEDNAEYGLGMFLGQDTLRNRVIDKVRAVADKAKGECKEAVD